MKPLAYYLALLTALLAHSMSHGAEIVLRERAIQRGALVRLGNIADISASTSAELKDLASTPLLPTPAPGTHQFLTVPQIRDLLVSRGLRLDQLSIQGATTVELSAATAQTPLGSTTATTTLTHKQVKLRVQQAIERHLQEKSKVGRWRVEVSLDGRDIPKLIQLGAKLEARAQRQLRSGVLRFDLSSEDSDEQLVVSASIIKIQAVVIAKQRIERGQFVRAADIEIREREGNLPRGTITDLDQAIGKQANRILQPDEIVLNAQLSAPLQVHRGETVSVFVRTGGIAVKSWAIAKENGAMGELITLETLEGKQRLDASVSGPGEVTIHATGGRATDYASLDRAAKRERPKRDGLRR